MSKPTIVVVCGPSFYGKSLHEILAEDLMGFHVVQAAPFTINRINDPEIFKASLAPKTNDPWYRQFDKKRKK